MPRKATRIPAVPLAFLLLLVGGFGLVAWWPREAFRPAVQEEVFVFDVEALQSLHPRELSPPAPQPTVPPREANPEAEPPPEPRSGLEGEDLPESGDMAVARGNTRHEEAGVAMPPPAQSPPSAPVFVDQQPGILKGAPPEYPARALERGLEGTVVALVTIDTNGRVTEARIEQGAGRDFDGPVLDAVRRISFRPLIRDGRKWPARFRIPYEFKIE